MPDLSVCRFWTQDYNIGCHQSFQPADLPTDFSFTCFHSCVSLFYKISACQTSPAVQWLRLSLPMQGAWVWLLVGEWGFHMLWGAAKNLKKKKKKERKQAYKRLKKQPSLHWAHAFALLPPFLSLSLHTHTHTQSPPIWLCFPEETWLIQHIGCWWFGVGRRWKRECGERTQINQNLAWISDKNVP